MLVVYGFDWICLEDLYISLVEVGLWVLLVLFECISQLVYQILSKFGVWVMIGFVVSKVDVDGFWIGDGEFVLVMFKVWVVGIWVLVFFKEFDGLESNCIN